MTGQFQPNPSQEPTAISGYRAPEDQQSAKLRIDMSDKILLYAPSATPFLTMSGKVKGKRIAKAATFRWLEKDQEPRRFTATVAIDDVTTTLTATAGDTARVATFDLLRNLRTGEHFLVTVASATSTTTTVTRGIGGASSAVLAGDDFMILAPSFADNALTGDFKSIQEYDNYNYTQIFKTPFGFSGRDIVTDFYGGDEVMNETKWQAIKHKRSIEYALLFGKRHVIAASGSTKQRTMTGGLDYYITTNRWDVSGVGMTKRAFDEMLVEGLRWGRGGYLDGAGSKVLLHSGRIGVDINSWVSSDGSALQYQVLDKQIGFAAKRYVSPAGEVLLLHDPLLDEFFPDRAFLVDFNHVDYCPLNKRDTRLESDIQENDRDGQAFQYKTDAGVQVEFEKSHVAITGWGN